MACHIPPQLHPHW